MSNVLITASNGVDTLGEKLIPMAGLQLNVTDPFWYVSEMEEGIGSEPGYIKVVVPCNQGTRDALGYDVAFNPEGPSAIFKQGTPVKVLRRFQNAEGDILTPNLQGYRVTEVGHNAEIDAIEIIAKDARDKLTDICVTGRYIWSAVDSNVKFQQGWFPHFNPKGRPNCIFTPEGTPIFAPYPDFGLAADELPADPAERSIGRACYFTLELILQYFRTFYAYETPADTLCAAARTAAVTAWPAVVRTFPEEIEWPIGFGSELDDVAEINFDSGLGQGYSLLGGGRKGRDINTNGIAFCGQNGAPGIFDMLFDAAGGWSYTMKTTFYSTTIFRNTLVAVPTRFRSEAEAVDLPYAYRGHAKDNLKYPTVTGGKLVEKSEMTRTRFVGMGSHVFIERRCSTRAADHEGGGTRTAENYGGSGTPALLPAWSLHDQDLCCTAAVDESTGSVTAESYLKALAKYWWVFTTYILNPQFNFMQGTNYENYPRAKITRPVLPTLLSFAGSTSAANDIQPYPVRPELYDSSKSSPAWTLGVEGDGLQVMDNGIIYLPGLAKTMLGTGGVENNTLERGAWRSATGSPWPVADGQLSVQLNDIRMTLAIPCDHRLMRSVNLLGSDSGSTRGQIVDSPDGDKFETDFSRTQIVDLNGLYVSWLRIDSYPVPESAGGTVADNYVDDRQAATALRSDSAQLLAHIKKAAAEHGRILCEGALNVGGRFVEGWKIGTQVKALKPVGTPGARQPFILNRVIARKRYTSQPTNDDNGVPSFKNDTWVVLQ
jgi:hypothetical protein